MNINSLNFLNLKKKVFYTLDERRASLYTDGCKYYKIWNQNIKFGPYFLLDGFDLINQGYDTLASKKLNLINKETCCAFDDLIYHNTHCCGYSTYAGITISSDYKKYEKKYLEFIDVLVEHSLTTDCFLIDVNTKNIIDYNDNLSLIDIDFIPVTISKYKKLSHDDQLRIDSYILTGNYKLLFGYNQISENYFSNYLNNIKKQILK